MQDNPQEPIQTDLPVKLASPARRALAQAGIFQLEQLAGYTEAQIAEMHGIGPNALQQLRQALAENGLAFSTRAAGAP
jgi:DNA-binding IscR family transcriptional regulator